MIVVSGVAEFVQEIDGQRVRQTFRPGPAIIVPAGIWHTADVAEPFSAVWLPCVRAPSTAHDDTAHDDTARIGRGSEGSTVLPLV